MKYCIVGILVAVFCFSSCSKNDDPHTPDSQSPQLIFVVAFDENQPRLNNIGEPAVIAAGNAAQTPVFHGISAHYFELAANKYTALGKGAVLYKAPETTQGGDAAIDFEKSNIVQGGDTLLSVPLDQIAAGTYEYLRVSLAYQKYAVKLRYNSMDIEGYLASFIGFNTYIKTHQVNTQSVAVNDNRKQGYWAFETPYSLNEGQANITTVPNPLFATSPIPAGSCVVTGAFNTPLHISGNETKSIVVKVSLSNNHSFEWRDLNGNGYWEPLSGESPVDMGIRGMLPTILD